MQYNENMNLCYFMFINQRLAAVYKILSMDFFSYNKLRNSLNKIVL